jgi:hypothetical protein
MGSYLAQHIHLHEDCGPERADDRFSGSRDLESVAATNTLNETTSCLANVGQK